MNHDTVERSQAHRLVIPSLAMSIDDSLPTDLASAHALIIAQRQALSAAELRATAAESEAQYRALLIEKLKFTIRKLRHDQFGQSSERGALLDQLELQLADLEADAAQADTAAQMAVAVASEKMMVPSFERRWPARRPLPEHLPRERIVYPAPSACPCCGGTTLRKIGEDVTETLELVPRQWKVVQHVREKFSCRACEAISQPPAPSHPIARGRAGPKLLAHILFSKYGVHLPLNRQNAWLILAKSKNLRRARIDALFAIEREINGLAPPQRVGVRTERSRPLVTALESWLREQRARVSKNSDTGKAIEYSLKRWTALTRFLDDGRLCMTNNAAERELRAIAVGRRNWTFAGSDEGGRRAAALYTLIATALCRARHNAVYAARRTMPNGSATMRCLGEFAGRRAGILLFHSA